MLNYKETVSLIRFIIIHDLNSKNQSLTRDGIHFFSFSQFDFYNDYKESDLKEIILKSITYLEYNDLIIQKRTHNNFGGIAYILDLTNEGKTKISNFYALLLNKIDSSTNINNFTHFINNADLKKLVNNIDNNL